VPGPLIRVPMPGLEELRSASYPLRIAILRLRSASYPLRIAIQKLRTASYPFRIALVERALEAELTDHLGYDEHAVEGRGSGNSRNGSGTKTLQTEQGPVPIDVPRDRNGGFEPQLVEKHQRRFDGFDDKILCK
jgi:hypothetical protein